ncbi:hypothetical protein CEXT_180121 [Caerostris extrusa]|uniref:Uncharacterized protein n=1 Tax=Caerostris extrusa TaxID=172846 RepID=A0AAV4RGI0_CAEEX|nr:hypothetical protein CEXT_180121 [Caerostris extrusa]
MSTLEVRAELFKQVANRLPNEEKWEMTKAIIANESPSCLDDRQSLVRGSRFVGHLLGERTGNGSLQPIGHLPTVIKPLPEDGLQISILAPDSVDRQARSAIHWLMAFVNPATDIHRAMFKSPNYARLIKVASTQESDCCDAPETTQPILGSNSCLSDFSTRKIR